jgi:hypothetical protein
MQRWVVLVLILLLVVACGPGDWTNRLPYAGPVEKGIERGGFLPGTGIQYLGQVPDGAQVSIAGEPAIKKIGDSLDWKQDMVPGVSVDQTYRVALISEETLHAAGTARIIIWNAIPQPEAANTEAPVHFKLPVGYHVNKGETIPGTVLTYLGQDEQGAHLGNIEGYAYRKVGDSILWEGRLRNGIWLELDLRTALITDSVLDVIGTADLWITPAGTAASVDG